MNFKDLHIHGEVRTDLLHRILYSTDASAYRETPLAVAFPIDEQMYRRLYVTLPEIILI